LRKQRLISTPNKEIPFRVINRSGTQPVHEAIVGYEDSQTQLAVNLSSKKMTLMDSFVTGKVGV
jgi:hypothetical protein